MAALATGADVLVYEALRFERYRALVGDERDRTFILDYHADTVAIGCQAAALGVPTLILTHLIPPPRDPGDERRFADDVRSGGDLVSRARRAGLRVAGSLRCYLGLPFRSGRARCGAHFQPLRWQKG